MSNRRLPIYLLIDNSGSMSGEPIEAVKDGLQMLVSSLQTDARAAETAYVSLISFSSTPKVEFPLTQILDVQIPNLRAEGSTSMGAALSLLAQNISNEVISRSSEEVKGDWRPLVFLFTDGAPTDDYQAGISAIKSARTASIISLAAGSSARTDILSIFSTAVLTLDTVDKAKIKDFFKWVSQSIKTTSTQLASGTPVSAGGADVAFPEPPKTIKAVFVQ